ncbi:MAG TPA: SUF system NifU family Fe-S cluster assembly protein [Verrucomicrobiae bacterium]|nr:SUF system NifU family Fe-S cluster assembly protein [Verrucomicrobiae bacterium]
MLEELYQEIILDHYRRPRNKGKVDPADFQAREYNPLCGDEIEVTARVKDGRIAEVKFDGHGCSISQASASIMTQKLVGKTVGEARQLIDSFLKMMRGEAPFGGREMGDLKALEGVLKFPVRVKCATLAWNTARNGIDQRGLKSEIQNPKESQNR